MDVASDPKPARRSPGQRTAPERPGRREENKHRKLTRIAKAAKQVLATKGFDAATMQAIAKLAGVATGTLFLYADNKRDLAYLAIADDFAAAAAACELVPTDLPFVEQIVAFWQPYFVMYNANPEMAKIILSEFLFVSGKQARPHGEGVLQGKAEIARRAQLCQQRGELDAALSTTDIADLTYYIYQGVVRRWVQAGALNVNDALNLFRQALELALAGARKGAGGPRPG